jgi:hypothetical protein
MAPTDPAHPTAPYTSGDAIPPCTCGHPDRFHDPPCPWVPDAIHAACSMALGRSQPDQDALPVSLRAAWRSLTAMGSGEECYLRRFPAGGTAWEWLSSERLPRGTFYPADRCAQVEGEAFAGDLIATYCRVFSRGVRGRASLDRVQLVIDERKPLRLCAHSSRRDGRVEVTLPGGGTCIVPSPDWR